MILTLQKLLLAPAIATAAVLSAGCAISVSAPVPAPNFVAAGQFANPIAVSVEGVTDDEECGETPGIRPICVTGLQTAMTRGFEDLMFSYAGPAGEPLVATLEVIDFAPKPAAVAATGQVAAVYLEMRWRFFLASPEGGQLVALADTTVGPRAVGSAGAAEDGFGALEAAVLEEISASLNEAIRGTDAGD